MDVLTILDLLMFATACVFLLAGFPVAFTLAGTALIFMALGILLGGLSPSDLSALPSRIFGIMTNEVLIAAPLFIFMGVVLERSRVAEELLDEMGALFGSIRGGMGYSVLFVGTLMAASTGIVGATVVTMGLISLPAMLRRGYDPQLSTGLISAAGTLGQIIPPSIILILLSDVISNAYQKAQLEAGNFSPEPLSVGDLFAGALIPGLGLVALYAGYITLMGVLRPETCPPVNDQQAISPGERLIRVAGTLAPPILLIVSVLGSILAGITTPTEAAAVGAIGAVLIAGFRLCRKAETGPSTLPIIAAGLALIGLLALQGMFDLRLGRETVAGADQAAIWASFVLCALVAWGVTVSLLRLWPGNTLQGIMTQTVTITTMVFVIFIGATLFSLVFRALGGDETVSSYLESLPGGTVGAVIAVMAVMFLLGFFLDFIEIVFVVVPVVAPALLGMGLDPVWLGIMMAINLQTSFLTPPFGFALFYLRGVAPKSVKTAEIYRGVIPFVCIQVVALALLALFPGLATWLPSVLF